jgi:hypothetical protein
MLIRSDNPFYINLEDTLNMTTVSQISQRPSQNPRNTIDELNLSLIKMDED